MEYPFKVRQTYQRLVSKATQIEPAEYESWEADTELYFFAEEIYDIFSSFETTIPNPSFEREKFNEWLESNMEYVSQYIYNNFVTDVESYETYLAEQKDDDDYDRYRDSLL